MAERYPELLPKHREFIEQQHIFFVATAAAEGHINVSPKGMDALRVLAPDHIIWLNLTGSGNETHAHLLENDRMTLMFCSFDQAPLILRVYGHASVITPDHSRWPDLLAHFPPYPGPRQIVDLAIELVQTSCGFGVPRYEYLGDRDTLVRWGEQKGDEGLAAFRRKYNLVSLDGKPIPLPPHLLGEAPAEDSEPDDSYS
ncbi:MAG: pyridoxamine 5'-phosphate oxidase family protein [Caldilineae bacterium]|nr:MAG: pyridoxamine 5'-phosphate oxidase family protein [Caldilineae bacterium]